MPLLNSPRRTFLAVGIILAVATLSVVATPQALPAQALRCQKYACGAPPEGPETGSGTDSTTFFWQLQTLDESSARYSEGAVAETDYDDVDEAPTSPVTLNACGSWAKHGIRQYSWSFSNGSAGITTSACEIIWNRPLSHIYASVDVTLTITTNQGLSLTPLTRTIRYRDVVIASLGDSAASGQGAPDSLPPGLWGGRYTASPGCYRSGRAASALAAWRLQENLPDTTVHFWHLACSGARITSDDSAIWKTSHGESPMDFGGMLTPFDGIDHNMSLEPQVQRLGELIQQTASPGHSALPVDRLLITIGANDLEWARVVQTCLIAGGITTLVFAVFGAHAENACLLGYEPAVAQSLSALSAHFNALHMALDTLPVSPQNIYLTSYFDPIDSLSQQPVICGGEVFADLSLRNYGARSVEDPLQQTVKASATGGWKYIDGIRQAFQGHGVCWLFNRWVNSWSDSVSTQGNFDGSWHANVKGQEVVSDIIYSNIAPGI